MRIEVESEALDSLKAMAQRLQTERDDLLAFANEYLQAWDDGMGGDSYLRRIAESVVSKCTAKPEVLE